MGDAVLLDEAAEHHRARLTRGAVGAKHAARYLGGEPPSNFQRFWAGKDNGPSAIKTVGRRSLSRDARRGST
jgi:hypothetical protein